MKSSISLVHVQVFVWRFFGKAKMTFVHWKFQTNTRDVIAEQFSEEIEEFERFSIFVGFIHFVVNHCSSLSKR